MPHYVVDFYSWDGKIVGSKRVFADDDAAAEIAAISLAKRARPAAYKVIKLALSGNMIIRDRQSLPPERPIIPVSPIDSTPIPKASYLKKLTGIKSRHKVRRDIIRTDNYEPESKHRKK